VCTAPSGTPQHCASKTDWLPRDRRDPRPAAAARHDATQLGRPRLPRLAARPRRVRPLPGPHERAAGGRGTAPLALRGRPAPAGRCRTRKTSTAIRAPCAVRPSRRCVPPPVCECLHADMRRFRTIFAALLPNTTTSSRASAPATPAPPSAARAAPTSPPCPQRCRRTRTRQRPRATRPPPRPPQRRR